MWGKYMLTKQLLYRWQVPTTCTIHTKKYRNDPEFSGIENNLEPLKQIHDTAISHDQY